MRPHTDLAADKTETERLQALEDALDYDPLRGLRDTQLTRTRGGR